MKFARLPSESSLSVLLFLLRKLLRVCTVLIGALLITFLLMHAIPGNPWSNYLDLPRILPGVSMDGTTQAALDRRFGLDLPLWRQFTRYLIGDFGRDGRWACGLICGDLGPSIQQRGRPVAAILFEPPEGMSFWRSRFGYSARLVLLAALIAVGLGVPLGLASAQRQASWVSRAISVTLAALIAIPNFVLGLLAMIVLASWLNIIPVLPDWNRPAHWIIPAIVLAIMPMASIARVTHASLLNTLGEDYVRTARAKGLTQGRILLIHVLRNAVVPIITFLGPALMEMFAGLLVVENLYAFPGWGREYWQAVLRLDYPVIVGMTLTYAIGMVLINVVIDILSEVLDPRIRAVKQAAAP